ncbi:MAG: hypothetical protein IKO40_11380 [Kiritimatiellae bacterium]|nr:hypothetical protein [Kiritimatiellia bacterium]
MPINNIKSILQIIHDTERVNREESKNQDGYSRDKAIIKQVFEKTSDDNIFDISTRLHLIDGMYSTQMNKRYYAIDDIAEMLLNLQNQEKKRRKDCLAGAFRAFAQQPTENMDRFIIGGKNIWGAGFGIDKETGSDDNQDVAVSLISKYAYFLTDCKFPIFDSIAREVFPLLWGYAQLGRVPQLVSPRNGKLDGKETIKLFILAINELLTNIYGECENYLDHYDPLDRLMWTTGKMLRGNFSLVLSKKEYKDWAQKVRNAFQQSACGDCGHKADERQQCRNRNTSVSTITCANIRAKILRQSVRKINRDTFKGVLEKQLENRKTLLLSLYDLAVALAEIRDCN